jgi:stage II sporulation protein R
MKWKIWERALAIGMILSLAVCCTKAVAASEDIPSRVLRLHILANSDTTADQSLKLKVRDRVLKDSSVWFTNAHTRAEAEQAAAKHIPEIAREAEDELHKNGSDAPVRVALENTWFPTRQYGNVTFPAGTYRALRVLIGKGAGHNWWCVLFPALCLPSAEPKQQLDDVLTQPETQLTGCPYQIKFKSVELYEELENWLKGGK